VELVDQFRYRGRDGERTNLLLKQTLHSNGTVCPVFRLDDVEELVGRMGDETTRSVGERGNILLEFCAEFGDGEDSRR